MIETGVLFQTYVRSFRDSAFQFIFTKLLVNARDDLHDRDHIVVLVHVLRGKFIIKGAHKSSFSILFR